MLDWNDTFRKIVGYNRWESVTELQYNCHEIHFEYIYELCNWNFLHHSKNTSTAAVFIDMHSTIDVLNFKYGNVANTRGTRQYAAGASTQGGEWCEMHRGENWAGML